MNHLDILKINEKNGRRIVYLGKNVNGNKIFEKGRRGDILQYEKREEGLPLKEMIYQVNNGWIHIVRKDPATSKLFYGAYRIGEFIPEIGDFYDNKTFAELQEEGDWQTPVQTVDLIKSLNLEEI